MIRTTIVLLLLTSTLSAADDEVWTVRIIETTREPGRASVSKSTPAANTTAGRQSSRTAPAEEQLTADLLRAMLDHSQAMSEYAMTYGVAHHGNQAVRNAHLDFITAIKRRESSASLRKKYQQTATLYRQWSRKHENQIVTDRHHNPLNR